MTDATTLRLAVVGWGGRGGGVAATAHRATGGCVVTTACVEPYDDAYARGCAASGQTPARYRTVPEMVAAGGFDAALVGSPNQFHLQHLRELEPTGLPIFLEKPLEATFDNICEVVRFARRYPAPLMVGHNMRYSPVTVEAATRLARGDLGRVGSVRLVQNCHYGSGGYRNWRRRRDTSGTWLLEKATHDFDCMLALYRDLPTTVAAVQRLQAFGGDRPDDLRCRACPERVTCPESLQNTYERWGAYQVEELKHANDLCVFAREIDTPDNDCCLFQFAGGGFGTYQQWFYSPRSYHHRIYEFHGTLGALEVDYGDEFGGRVLYCPRYGTHADRQEYRFDYLMRNHYNGDSPMTVHWYHVARGEARPQTTVEQAFLAELLSYAAIRAADTNALVDARSLLPPDLADIYRPGVY